MESIYTVSALTEVLRDALEKRVPFAWVRGEVTNLSRPHSGHIYFSLKDNRSQIACVWFAGNQESGGKFDPLTGEVFEEPRIPFSEEIRNGMEILCAGGIGVYAPKGQYQILVELCQPVGLGGLAIQFERLKRKLEAAGYFDLQRKRELPQNPVRVALVTSPHGAAIHDFLELARNRGISAKIRLFPVPVQGQEASGQIAEAIRVINSQGWAQVIVLIRGGGSLEDLWAFNEETLAQAIFESGLPVLAGIGHEVDFTLADLTADVRAATPSHAAQLLWPERAELWQRLDDLDGAFMRAIRHLLDKAGIKLERLAIELSFASPGRQFPRLEQKLGMLCERMKREADLTLARSETRFVKNLSVFESAFRLKLDDGERALDNLEVALKALDPARPMSRGYALIYGRDGLASSVDQIHISEELKIVLEDGTVLARVEDVTPRLKN